MSRQLPACDRCTQGVMDTTNDHARGLCSCPCHEPTAQQLARKSQDTLPGLPAPVASGMNAERSRA